MIKNILTPIFLFAFANVLFAQTITVDINNLGSLNPGTQTIQVTYQANGDFQASDGTDDWGGQVLTLGWTPESGMNISAPSTNSNITNFTSDFLPFVGAFTGNNTVVTWSLMDVGGTDDGNVYFSVVVNTSTVDKPLSDGSIAEVFRFDIPDTWTGPDNSVFLLPTQPAGPPIQLAPKIDNNGVGGNVWDGGSAGAPLPIELAYFDAFKMGTKDALLSWETIFEINASHFEIQASRENRLWKAIELMQSEGYETSRKQYEYIHRDAGLISDQWYYRLKMVDRDGSYKYSDTRVVRFNKQSEDEFLIYPNPCVNYVEVKTAKGRDLEFILFTHDGKRLFNKYLEGEVSRIDMTNLLPGKYQAVILDQQGQVYKQLPIIVID